MPAEEKLQVIHQAKDPAGAVTEIVKILAEVEPVERERVLSTVAVFFNIRPAKVYR